MLPGERLIASARRRNTPPSVDVWGEGRQVGVKRGASAQRTGGMERGGGSLNFPATRE